MPPWRAVGFGIPSTSAAMGAPFSRQSIRRCDKVIRMKRLVIALLLTSAPVWAQLEGFSKEQLIKYTATNPYDRFDDGRPKVPQEMIDALQNASSIASLLLTTEALVSEIPEEKKEPAGGHAHGGPGMGGMY